VGGQAGIEDAGAFLKFSKTMNFSIKKYPHKSQDLFSYALLLSVNNTNYQREKIFSRSHKIPRKVINVHAEVSIPQIEISARAINESSGNSCRSIVSSIL